MVQPCNRRNGNGDAVTELKIKVEGLDKLMKGFERFPREIAREMSQAGHESADVILNTQGMRNYPPLTSANFPPVPYYQRGFGVRGSSAAYNRAVSENLGKKWHVRRLGSGGTEIGNVASYAKYVHGDEQAKAMAAIGWRKLKDVASEKTDKIRVVYQKWINRLIRRLGL